MELHNYFANSFREDIYKVWEIAIARKQKLLCNTLDVLQSHELCKAGGQFLPLGISIWYSFAPSCDIPRALNTHLF